MKTIREIKKDKLIKKYTEIYQQVQEGKPFSALYKQYGYKNVESMRQVYYFKIIPLFKN